MATKKTTGNKSTTKTGKSATNHVARGTAPRGASPKRAKLMERPKLKVGSRPVSAVRRKPKSILRSEQDDAPGEELMESSVSSRSYGAPAASTKTTVAARSRARKGTRKAPLADDSGRRRALAIAEAALEKKALHVEVIDVRGKVDYADYVVVMSGRSDRQVTALARSIEEELLRKERVRCSGVEGLGQGAWVLMDFGDVIVHIFHEDMRGYYDLESLWSDAARVDVGP